MASSSSSTNMAFPRADGNIYDVFLSFRGPDTRDSFTDHLYDKLTNAGIHTFRDNDEIDVGEELAPEIVRAIKASETSIIVLSKTYATSTWCLDELQLILEKKSEGDHFVLPVFYDVDPSDVRKQNKTFKIQAKTTRWTDDSVNCWKTILIKVADLTCLVLSSIEVKTSTRWTQDNVNKWKAALTNVANLSGSVVSGPETTCIKEIVDIIYNKLDRKPIHLPTNLVGMEPRVQMINSWLKQSEAQVLVIYGMGGSGKSTLAEYVVHSNWKYFDNISIVERIGSRCKEKYDVLQLREQLFNDILGGKNRRIPTICQGSFKIKEVLRTKKALIVLDDIVERNQLDSLLGAGSIHKQSKIIITTTQNDLDVWLQSRSLRYQEYKMERLDDDESLKLLCFHAFGSKILMEGYEELAKQVVQYCEGNPLALEVLGSSLRDENSVTSWESAVKLLGKDIHDDIYSKLKRSYDSLPYETDKELFLHIACFFVGKDVDYAVKILDPDYSAISRINVLKKRCLVYVTPNRKLMMHRLLQEMGRSIVDRESRTPRKRSRVWRNAESYDILKRGKGSTTIIGLALDMQGGGFKLRDESQDLTEPLDFPDSLQEMDQLHLLQLSFVSFKPFDLNFPKCLRWLCWVGYKGSRMPYNLCMGNMVALDMSYSFLKEFELPAVVPSLKILNLKSSSDLKQVLFISRLPNLEALILWNCYSLVHICESIENLTSLGLLNMSGCENLQCSFSLPCSLERLFLKDCNLQRTNGFPLSFSDQPLLKYLNLGNCFFELLPSYNHLKSLRVLDLSLCSRLRLLLCLPSTLAELYIYYCTSLEIVTFESHRYTLQEFGYEGCSNLHEIEGFIKLVPLTKLDEADLEHMTWLKEYQNYVLRLAGDDELMKDRSCNLQMLYEFNIRSISLPEIKNPNIRPKYISESTSLSFEVPLDPKNRKLKGLNITFKYTVSSVDDWVWFAKIRTNNGVDLIYNPKVFGKPESGEMAIWLGYWPIGDVLKVGDSVYVSIDVIQGLEIHECGASLVYADGKVDYDTLQNNIEWIEVLGGDLSRFKLSTGAYYLCRRDFFELMELGRLTPGWFGVLVGDNIDVTEVRGWRKTGRSQQSSQSFTELKYVRCIVYGPDSDGIYRIPETSKSSYVMTRDGEFTSNIPGGATNISGSTSEVTEPAKLRVTLLDLMTEIQPTHPSKKDTQEE